MAARRSHAHKHELHMAHCPWVLQRSVGQARTTLCSIPLNPPPYPGSPRRPQLSQPATELQPPDLTCTSGTPALRNTPRGAAASLPAASGTLTSTPLHNRSEPAYGDEPTG